MSLRKQTQEIYRTRRRLANWLDRHPQGPTHFSSMLETMTGEIAGILGAPASTVGVALTEPPLSTQVSPFFYDESLLKSWSAGSNRPIDDFSAKHARRERPLGRRYLTALAQSTPRVWEIVDVDYGSSVSVRRLREKPNPTDKVRRVYDVFASESLIAGDALLGRILPMPEGRIFAESILPLSRSEAMTLLRTPEQSIIQAGFVSWGVTILRELKKHDYSSHGAPLGQSRQDDNNATHEHEASLDSLNPGANNALHEHLISSEAASANTVNTEKTNQHTPPVDRAKLLERIRKLFAMAQETEASPHEAEIALRRCQKLMTRYGIREADLHNSRFSAEVFRAGIRVPMHIKWLALAVEELHSVLFVTGGQSGPEFRGFEIDVKVAKMAMEYLEDATERSLLSRKRSGRFPAGRSAAYDYRVSFAMEVKRRVSALVDERKAAEVAQTSTGTTLTVKKMEIVQRECTQDLITTNERYNSARCGEAADAGRIDGSKISLDPQVKGDGG